jgi:hypothetical protein
MNITLEIRAAVADFISHYGITVEYGTLEEFFRHLEKKRSLVILNLDCISAVENFLYPQDMLSLVRTCKYTYGRIGLTRSRICNLWYPDNTLSGVDPTDRWRYMCADWYEFKLDDSAMCGAQHRDMVRSEKSIKYCQHELDDLMSKKTKNTPDGTIAAIELYQKQIAVEQKNLDKLRNSSCQGSSCAAFSFMRSCIKWMIPSGNLMDLPTSDVRLRDGMTRVEYNELQAVRQAEETDDYYYEDDEYPNRMY